MDPKVRAMVSHIEEFEYITTSTEMEALILENNLIKKYRPRTMSCCAMTRPIPISRSLPMKRIREY
jgi:excinuclease UvrABC nuclease subunit